MLRLLTGVSHAPRRLSLVALLDALAGLRQQRLAVLGLLVRLRQLAAATAAGRRHVDEAAALEVVLGAQVRALHGHGDPVAADAARGAEEEALSYQSVTWPNSRDSRKVGRLTVVLIGSNPSSLALLRMRWCVLPKTTQGQHHDIRHVSIGLKQPKNMLYHGCELSGDLELTYSPGRASTSLKRAVHSATSSLLIGPWPGWAGWCC